MKSWLAKFRISAALDAGRPLPESLRRAIAADPDLERFTRRAEALGRALRNAPKAEPEMRDSIMRAVRAAGRSEQPRRAAGVAWLAAASVAVAVVVCCWIGLHRPPAAAAQAMDGPARVLEMSEKIPNTMPFLVMAPLSNEWARVDRNLQSTTQVLLASFP